MMSIVEIRHWSYFQNIRLVILYWKLWQENLLKILRELFF